MRTGASSRSPITIELGGKKAWTWGEWEFGKVAQKNLTDEDGPYIEVQSGPLPTQSDYGMLGPHERVAWQEYWYPVHGLGDGFEFATRDLAAQTARRDGQLQVRLLATRKYDRAKCVLARDGRPLVEQQVSLSPGSPALVSLAEEPQRPVDVTVTTQEGHVLAAFTTPLPIPKVEPPDPAKFAERPDEQLTVEELYLKGRKSDRATDRRKAREYYEKALARDAGHVDSLRALAVLDFEAGLYATAAERVQKALDRDSDDGLCWFYLGACHFRRGDFAAAQRCGYRAARCPGTAAIGYDLAGRAAMRLGDRRGARHAFADAFGADGSNYSVAADHLMLFGYVAGESPAETLSAGRLQSQPTAIVPRVLQWLGEKDSPADLTKQIGAMLGEDEFELLEASLVFAELGLFKEAARIVEAGCVDRNSARRAELPAVLLPGLVRISGRRCGVGSEVACASC